MNSLDFSRFLDEYLALNAMRGATPFAQVTLRGASGRRVTGRAKLDTGALKNFIAPSVAKRLGLKRKGSEVVRGIGGPGRRAAKYEADLTVAGIGVGKHMVFDYPALDKRGDVALIGRDAMAGRGHGLRIEYDGPSGRTKVSASKRRPK